MRLLVDISGLAYRAAYKVHLTDRRGNNTGVAYGVLLALESLAARLQPEEMVICWDRGTPQARIDLAPEYKADRKPKDEKERLFKADVRRQLEVVQSVLSNLPVIQVWRDGFEADDVIAVLCDFLRLEPVGVVTTDRDIYSAVAAPLHTVYDPTGVRAKLTLRPDQYLTYNVLVGGKNNLKGIKGVGAIGARELIAKHDTLKAIMAEARATGKLGSMSYEAAKAEVIKLLRVMTPGSIMEEMDHRAVVEMYRSQRGGRRHPGPVLNPLGLKRDITALGFASILARFRGFTVAFNSLTWAPYENKKASGAGPVGQRRGEGNFNNPAQGKVDTRNQNRRGVQDTPRSKNKATDGVGYTTRLVRKTNRGRSEGTCGGVGLRGALQNSGIRIVRKTAAGGRGYEHAAGGSPPDVLDDGRRFGRKDSSMRHVRVLADKEGNENHTAPSRAKRVEGSGAGNVDSGRQGTARGRGGNGEGAGVSILPDGLANWWRTDKGRRRDTLSCVTAVVNDTWWVQRQPTSVVQFLRGLITKCAEDLKYQPTQKEQTKAESIHDAWCNVVLPDWAL